MKDVTIEYTNGKVERYGNVTTDILLKQDDNILYFEQDCNGDKKEYMIVLKNVNGIKIENYTYETLLNEMGIRS